MGKTRTDRGKFRTGTCGKLTREELWNWEGSIPAQWSHFCGPKSSELGVDSRDKVIAYLNGLVGRVHGTIIARSLSDGDRLRNSSYRGLAARESVWYLAVSTGIFVLFGVLGFHRFG